MVIIENGPNKFSGGLLNFTDFYWALEKQQPIKKGPRYIKKMFRALHEFLQKLEIRNNKLYYYITKNMTFRRKLFDSNEEFI